MKMYRATGVMLSALACMVTSGCMVDITPTLPPISVDSNFPLIGAAGVPILGEAFLPNIDTCETISEEALLIEVEDSEAATFFVKLLLDIIEIKNVSIIAAVMEAEEPEGSSFNGLTAISFLENDRPIVRATANDGINGNRIELTTDNPINLIDVINACPERASNIRVKVEGLVPLNAPTKWNTRVTVRIVAGLSLF